MPATALDNRIQSFLKKIHLYPSVRVYTITLPCLLVFCFLLFPGNPVWDWSETRTPNAILIYLNILLLSAAIYTDRQTILRWLAKMQLNQRVLLFSGLPIILAATIMVLYHVFPDYLQSLLREYGLAEPFTIFFYLMAAMAGFEHFRALREKRQDFRPYKMLAYFYLILAFEECDWLGIFGAFFGRINGAYVGSIHDIGNLWYRSPHKDITGTLIILAAAGVIYALWKKKYIHAAFLKKEITAPSTMLIYSWFILSIIAGIYDIDGDVLMKFKFPDFPEEALEMLATLLLLIASLLKYIRDTEVQKSGSAHERKDF